MLLGGNQINLSLKSAELPNAKSWMERAACPVGGRNSNILQKENTCFVTCKGSILMVFVVVICMVACQESCSDFQSTLREMLVPFEGQDN